MLTRYSYANIVVEEMMVHCGETPVVASQRQWKVFFASGGGSKRAAPLKKALDSLTHSTGSTEPIDLRWWEKQTMKLCSSVLRIFCQIACCGLILFIFLFLPSGMGPTAPPMRVVV